MSVEISVTREELGGVFRRAAERICEGVNIFACIAVKDVITELVASKFELVGDPHCADSESCYDFFRMIAERHFADAIKPEGFLIGHPWWQVEGRSEQRTLALLFAAEFIEDSPFKATTWSSAL